MNLSVSLSNQKDLDNETQLFVKIIQQAAWDNIPKIIPRTKGHKRENIN